MTKDDSKISQIKMTCMCVAVHEGQMPTVGFRTLLLPFETGFVLNLEFAILAGWTSPQTPMILLPLHPSTGFTSVPPRPGVQGGQTQSLILVRQELPSHKR